MGLNLGPESSASLIFLILFMKNEANSSANSSLFIEVGRGLDYSLPVIVSMSLNSFLVSFPASITCEDSIWVSALLIMAIYFFPLHFLVLSIDVQLCIFSKFVLFFQQCAFAFFAHLHTMGL